MITKNLLISEVSNTIQVRDTDLGEILYTVLGVNDIITWAWDATNGKLHTHDTSNQYHRFDLTDIGFTEEAEIALGTNCRYGQLVVVPNGDAYICEGNITYNLTTNIYKIGLLSTAIDSTLGLGSPAYNKGIISTSNTGNVYNAHLMYDDHRDVLVWTDHVSHHLDSTSSYNTSIGGTVDLALTTVKRFTLNNVGFGISSSSHDFYDYPVKNSSVAYYNTTCYNPRTTDILRVTDRGSKNAVKLSFKLFNSDFNYIKTINPELIAGDPLPKDEITFVYPDKISGGYILVFETSASSAGGMYLVNSDLTLSTKLNAYIPTDYFFGINPLNNNFYFSFHNGTNYVTKLADIHGNIIKSIDTSGGYTKMEVISPAGTLVDTLITPPTITYPNNYNTTEDTTPYVIVKAGTSDIASTQQFRVVVDSDPLVIASNDPDAVFSRAYDSWALGTNYDAGITWEYSLDHDPLAVDSTNGTWSPLGTGDGLKAGGVEPTNGVQSNTDRPVYVRMLIPALDALTGADTNTVWYFKAFSYSKTVA